MAERNIISFGSVAVSVSKTAVKLTALAAMRVSW